MAGGERLKERDKKKGRAKREIITGVNERISEMESKDVNDKIMERKIKYEGNI